MDSLTLFATVIFIITYILMFAFQKIRPYVAVVSAFIFVAVGSIGLFPEFTYTFSDALHQIDWNVLMMIAGTMGTVYLFIESGMPKLMSDILVSKLHSVKWLIVVLSLFAGIISAFVDNVATVLMVAPVAIALCKELKISPVPAIICISISSNLQGAATLVGDTTSILLAKAANLDFMDFFFVEGKPGMFWVTELGALASVFIILFKMRKENASVYLNNRSKVEDKVPTILLLLTVGSLIATSFIPYKNNALPGQLYKPDISNGLICIFFFLVGIIRATIKTKKTNTLKSAFKEIDYYTLALLAGLFVVIGGITEAGIIDRIGNILANISGDGSKLSIFIVYSVIVWMSVLCSAFIDNIPYTATMAPMIASIESIKGAAYVHPLWWSLALGACLGGNGTLVGASANLIVAGLAAERGVRITFIDYFKYFRGFLAFCIIILNISRMFEYDVV